MIERSCEIAYLMRNIELATDFPKEMMRETHWLLINITEIKKQPRIRIALVGPHYTKDYRILIRRNWTIWLNSNNVDSLID